jgi:DNA-binding Lrp family transcriptional regulator
MADKPQTFRATLEQLHDGLGWTVVRVPFTPSQTWKRMIRLRVRGTINGFVFRNSLFPYAVGGGYVLLVNKTMQKGADAHLGETAEFTLQPDLEPRPAELPDELATLLDEVEGLRTWYDSLSESMRREIGKWIAIAKTDAARIQRCEHMAERLLGAMEGENELPPVVAAAFRVRPKARAGWQKLTQTQRRQELLAIFYYRTPESRNKRVQKLCDNAEKRA